MKFRNILNKAVMGLAGVAAASGLLVLSSCQDDYLLSADHASDALGVVYKGVNFDENAGLIPQDDGTWKATRRVPLVGPCRIVDQLMHSLVSVGSFENDDLRNITDTDLTNSANVSGEVVGAAVAYNSVIAVRDLNYTYSGGQKAGFVIKINDSGVLNLNLLKQMVLVTSYLGEVQESKTVTTSSNLLALTLGNVTVGTENSLITLEAEFSKKFDEIRLDKGGVQADVLKSNLNVYYAFVGETAIEPVIKSTFPGCSTDTSDPAGEKKLIDDNLNNGPGYGLISAGRWRVNFGKDVEPGSEVGFYITDGSLLNLGIGATRILRTFDKNGNLMNEMTTTDVVGLGLASGSDLYYSMTVPDTCSAVEFAIGGVNVDLGGGTVHYAYVRKPVKPDATSYFALANATVYVPNYRLPSVDKGEVTYTVVSQPNEAQAKISPITDKTGGTALVGMYYPGNYVVRGEWTDENGEKHVEYATITRRVRSTKTCNEPFVNDSVFTNLQAYIPSKNGALLEIPLGSGINGSLENVVNENLSDALQFTKGLDVGLINVTGLIGIRSTDGQPIYSTGSTKARVGFVVNKENGVLGADVLNFYQVRVLDETGKVIKEAVSGGVNVSLIKGLDTPRIRLSVDIPENTPIYAIELYNDGLLSVGLATHIEVYYAFLDRDAESNCPDPGQECVELLNAANYRASADVKGFSIVGAGVTISNLGNMLDGRLDSYATIAVPLAVGQDLTLATKFDPIKAGTPVGFILHNDVNLASVIQYLSLRVHHPNGYEDIKAGGAANVSLGVDKYNYLQAFPTESMGEIIGLDLILGEGITSKGFDICGIFSRSDANADGMPDCFEDEDHSEGLQPELKLSSEDICASDLLEILVDKAVDGNYTLKVSYKETHDFEVTINDAGYLVPAENAKSSFLEFFSNSDNAGYYDLQLVPTDGIGYDSDPVKLKLHPEKTTWTGNENNSNWKDWENWSNGEPWECTDVIIPAGQSKYPVLEKDGTYRCQSIHFEAGAVLAGQQFLKYSGRVFADVKLEAGDYHLMSSPLKATVTGDMFVNPSWTLNSNDFDKYFEPLTAENYGEKRVNPTVYQRFWDERIPAIVTMSRGLIDPEFTDWTRTFNAVTDAYSPYQGFAVRVGKQDVDKGTYYTLHFPKSHSQYTYFDAEGQPLMATGSINRSTQTGRLWTDNFNGNDVQYVDLLRETPGKEFLFGNPFLTYIDVAKFKKSNPGVSVWQYSGGVYSEMSEGTIAPFSAVFLVVDENITDLEVKLNANDLTNTPSAE